MTPLEAFILGLFIGGTAGVWLTAYVVDLDARLAAMVKPEAGGLAPVLELHRRKELDAD